MLPTNAQDFLRFVYWAEAMLQTFARWSVLPDVQRNHDAVTLCAAHEALQRLARDSRDLLTRYEARKATQGHQEGR